MNHAPLGAPPRRPDARCPFSPSPEVKVLQREHPVHPVALPSGTVAYFVTSYEMSRKVLGDPRFSADVTRPGFPLDGHIGGRVDVFAKSLLRRDEPDHSRLRRLIAADFRADKVEQRYGGMVQDVVDGCLANVIEAGSPADLVALYTSEIPSIVVSRFLGIPEAMRPRMKQLALDVSKPLAPGERPSLELMADLLRAHLMAMEPDPNSPELFARMAALVVKGDMNFEELLSMGVLLALGGHETTANTLALGLAKILSEPQVVADLIANPKLLENVPDEMVRFATVVRSGPRRVSVEDVELGEQRFPKGTGFLLSLHGANYDEAYLADAEELRLDRDKPRSHMGFGFGLHQCLGQFLARMEMKAAVGSLLNALPGLKLAVPLEALAFHGESTMYGLRELPVSWST